MLVLNRRIREEIVIIDRATGEEIVVAPTGVRQKNQVKIGIEASKTRYTVLRREVRERDRAAALS